MRHVVIGLAMVVSAGVSGVRPATPFQQLGVKFRSPNEAGWVLVKAEKLVTVFEKNGFTARARTLQIVTPAPEVWKNLERRKELELRDLQRDSLHFNLRRFKNAQCLQYDGIFRATGASPGAARFFNFRGYFFRSPGSDRFVEVEFSSRSNQRGFSEDALSLSDEFFNDISLQPDGK